MSPTTHRSSAGVRDRLREFALSLPGAAEAFPWETRVVKVRGKIFVFLGPDELAGPRTIAVKLVESHAHALAIDGAEPTGYGLGRAGWVNVPVRAPGVTLGLLRDLVEESYLVVSMRGRRGAGP